MMTEQQIDEVARAVQDRVLRDLRQGQLSFQTVAERACECCVRELREIKAAALRDAHRR